MKTKFEMTLILHRGTETEHREVVKARLRQVLADIEMLEDGSDLLGELYDANGQNHNPKIGTVSLLTEAIY